MENVALRRVTEELLLQQEPVAEALAKMQSDEATLTNTIEFWLDLLARFPAAFKKQHQLATERSKDCLEDGVFSGGQYAAPQVRRLQTERSTAGCCPHSGGVRMRRSCLSCSSPLQGPSFQNCRLCPGCSFFHLVEGWFALRLPGGACRLGPASCLGSAN